METGLLNQLPQPRVPFLMVYFDKYIKYVIKENNET